jgi:hypothetical protein
MIFIELSYDRWSPELVKRQWNVIAKAAFEKVGLRWIQRFLDKHFTHAGAREYGYEPRSGELRRSGSKAYRRSYTGIKERMFGHTLPLVFTGTSRDRCEAGRVIPSRTGVRVMMNAPALNLRAKHSKINLREELTRVSIPEQRELTDLLVAEIDRGIGALRQAETKRLA